MPSSMALYRRCKLQGFHGAFSPSRRLSANGDENDAAANAEVLRGGLEVKQACWLAVGVPMWDADCSAVLAAVVAVAVAAALMVAAAPSTLLRFAKRGGVSPNTR